MARWADYPTKEQHDLLLALLKRLIASKPRGWSAGPGDRELVVRPARRGLGKFSVTIFPSTPSAREPAFSVAFFSRSLNQWEAYEYFPASEESCTEILEWAKARAANEEERAGKG